MPADTVWRRVWVILHREEVDENGNPMGIMQPEPMRDLHFICPSCGAMVKDVVAHGNLHRTNGERNG